jgi:hypothetical protein
LKTSRQKFARFATGWTLATALSAAMLLATAPSARADDDHEKCQPRIEKAEARLHDAIRHHGERSPQAESRRHELNEERERCWNSYHGWWNGVDHRWHSERDWDRDDHDHDHDDHR